MYEELVTALRKRAVELPEKFSKNAENIDLFLKAADVIEKLKKFYQIMADAYETEVTKERWIPVTERVPVEENRTYWVCTDTGYQCECRWTNNRFGIGESDEWGWSIADVPQYHKVVAWMFLPEPYEPPKEEWA